MCKTEGCSRPAYVAKKPNKKTGRPASSVYCNTCRNQREKDADLVKWAYRKWKSNAKRRNKIFKISIDYFRQFCVETQIMNGRGIGQKSLHIDCIIEELGYVEGNIRPLPNDENVKKEWERRKRVAFVSTYDETGRYELGGRLRMIDDCVCPECPDCEEPPF